MRINEEIDEETVLKLNLLLNTRLNGLTLADINLGLISNIKEEAGIHTEIVNEVLDTIAEVIRAETDEDMKIYTSGATNIFRYPELADGERAAQLISALEEKDSLAGFLDDANTDETGIQVYIGEESPVETMKDCSVVTATYDLGDGLQGTIGIIGPKRMDYERVMDNLKTVRATLNDVFKKNPGIADEKGRDE